MTNLPPRTSDAMTMLHEEPQKTAYPISTEPLIPFPPPPPLLSEE